MKVILQIEKYDLRNNQFSCPRNACPIRYEAGIPEGKGSGNKTDDSSRC